jgi:hypothetical protein
VFNTFAKSEQLMETSIEGGCLCRAIRYRVTGEPLAKTLCHCRSCRLASGAPSLAWAVFRSNDFVLTAGTPVSFQSSAGVYRTFCGTCGTSLAYRRMSRPDAIDVTTISLDHPENFAPTVEIWVEERVPWERLYGALPHYAGSSVGASPIDA